MTLLDRTTSDGTPVVMLLGTADSNKATSTPWEEEVSAGH
jgi:hypothetical protein